MGRKFMIVKPTLCCKSHERIGQVGKFITNIDIDEVECMACGKSYKAIGDEFGAQIGGVFGAITESRIVWLVDNEEVITHDMRIEENV